MTLPKETVERIRNEAEKEADTRYAGSSAFRIGFIDGCNWGATAEAERAQVLVDALEKIVRGVLCPKMLADKALSSYNKTQEDE